MPIKVQNGTVYDIFADNTRVDSVYRGTSKVYQYQGYVPSLDNPWDEPSLNGVIWMKTQAPSNDFRYYARGGFTNFGRIDISTNGEYILYNYTTWSPSYRIQLDPGYDEIETFIFPRFAHPLGAINGTGASSASYGTFFSIGESKYELPQDDFPNVYTAYQNKYLKRLYIGDEAAVNQIGNIAFAGSDMLEQVRLPSTLTRLGTMAAYSRPNYFYFGTFYGCNKIKEFDLRNCASLHIIDKNTFSRCQSLERIILPPNLTHLDVEFASNCENLKTIVMLGENPPKIVDQFKTAFDTGKFLFNCHPDLKIKVARKDVYKWQQAAFWGGFNVEEWQYDDFQPLT